ncbi:MAG: DUF4351 domain-containing protein [Opitutales bacterium]|nr:DUF4351 domain-containing protein [Opitutales bacterium]MCH8541895.1 DUF4351 domain-containing protein [Opitutales bacterium]
MSTLAQQFRQEGRQEGQLLGERLLLERQLTRKFGPLPEWAREKLADAQAQDLEKWGDAILEASSLEEIF